MSVVLEGLINLNAVIGGVLAWRLQRYSRKSVLQTFPILWTVGQDISASAAASIFDRSFLKICLLGVLKNEGNCSTKSLECLFKSKKSHSIQYVTTKTQKNLDASTCEFDKNVALL